MASVSDLPLEVFQDIISGCDEEIEWDDPRHIPSSCIPRRLKPYAFTASLVSRQWGWAVRSDPKNFVTKIFVDGTKSYFSVGETLAEYLHLLKESNMGDIELVVDLISPFGDNDWGGIDGYDITLYERFALHFMSRLRPYSAQIRAIKYMVRNPAVFLSAIEALLPLPNLRACHIRYPNENLRWRPPPNPRGYELLFPNRTLQLDFSKSRICEHFTVHVFGGFGKIIPPPFSGCMFNKCDGDELWTSWRDLSTTVGRWQGETLELVPIRLDEHSPLSPYDLPEFFWPNARYLGMYTDIASLCAIAEAFHMGELRTLEVQLRRSEAELARKMLGRLGDKTVFGMFSKLRSFHISHHSEWTKFDDLMVRVFMPAQMHSVFITLNAGCSVEDDLPLEPPSGFAPRVRRNAITFWHAPEGWYKLLRRWSPYNLVLTKMSRSADMSIPGNVGGFRMIHLVRIKIADFTLREFNELLARFEYGDKFKPITIHYSARANDILCALPRVTPRPLRIAYRSVQEIQLKAWNNPTARGLRAVLKTFHFIRVLTIIINGVDLRAQSVHSMQPFFEYLSSLRANHRHIDTVTIKVLWPEAALVNHNSACGYALKLDLRDAFRAALVGSEKAGQLWQSGTIASRMIEEPEPERKHSVVDSSLIYEVWSYGPDDMLWGGGMRSFRTLQG